MVVCKYYAAGSCGYGESCRFEHPVSVEMNRYRWSGASQLGSGASPLQRDLRQMALVNSARPPPPRQTFASPLHQRMVTFSDTPVVQTPNFQSAQTSTPRQSILKASGQTDLPKIPKSPVPPPVTDSNPVRNLFVPEYSDRHSLTPEDLNEFLKSQFSRVPIDPPPMEFC